MLPSGPEVLNRTEMPLPDLNTLSGRSSPLRSTRASWPSVLLWVKPTLAPALPYLLGAAELKPAYRWPPTLVLSDPDSALAWPRPSSPAVTPSAPTCQFTGAANAS